MLMLQSCTSITVAMLSSAKKLEQTVQNEGDYENNSVLENSLALTTAKGFVDDCDLGRFNHHELKNIYKVKSQLNVES